jgi:hypothetical protein
MNMTYAKHSRRSPLPNIRAHLMHKRGDGRDAGERHGRIGGYDDESGWP